MPRRKEWLDAPDGEGFFWMKAPEGRGQKETLTVGCVSTFIEHTGYMTIHLIGYAYPFNQSDLLKPAFQGCKWKRIPKP